MNSWAAERMRPDPGPAAGGRRADGSRAENPAAGSRRHGRALAAALVLAAGLAGCGRGPQVDLAAARAELEARSAGLSAAETARDRDAALAYWADAAVVHFAGAPTVVGRDGMRAVYDQFFAQVRSFETAATRIDMSASGDLAWELGANRAVVIGGQADLVDIGKYLAVWQKIEGEWYVVAVSSTSDSPFMAPAEP